jgi:hypothetical protein
MRDYSFASSHCLRKKNAGRNRQLGAFKWSEVTQTCTFPASSKYGESNELSIRLAVDH